MLALKGNVTNTASVLSVLNSYFLNKVGEWGGGLTSSKTTTNLYATVPPFLFQKKGEIAHTSALSAMCDHLQSDTQEPKGLGIPCIYTSQM